MVTVVLMVMGLAMALTSDELIQRSYVKYRATQTHLIKEEERLWAQCLKQFDGTRKVMAKRFDIKGAYMITQMTKEKSDNVKKRCAVLTDPLRTKCLSVYDAIQDANAEVSFMPLEAMAYLSAKYSTFYRKESAPACKKIVMNLIA